MFSMLCFSKVYWKEKKKMHVQVKLNTHTQIESQSVADHTRLYWWLLSITIERNGVSLVKPGLRTGSVVDHLSSLEPQIDLTLCVFDCVAAVDHVPGGVRKKNTKHPNNTLARMLVPHLDERPFAVSLACKPLARQLVIYCIVSTDADHRSRW